MKSRHRRNEQETVTCFTMHQIALMQFSLVYIQEYVDRADSTLPNIGLAKETMITLREKFVTMASPRGSGRTIGFDANEVLLLHTALRLFKMRLTMEKQQMIRECDVLINHFAPLLTQAVHD